MIIYIMNCSTESVIFTREGGIFFYEKVRIIFLSFRSLDIITFLEALQKALNKQLEDREVLSKQ